MIVSDSFISKGPPRTQTKMESDEKLGGAWKRGYINAVIVQEKIYVV